jgi:hypothetical protein
MRLAIALALSACWSSNAKPKPAPPVPTEGAARSCNDAAAGIEKGTRGIREPEVSVLGPMRAACTESHWSAAAIECFTKMTEDDLGKCAGLLDAKQRDKLFGALGGSYNDRTAIAIAVARLANVKVGIQACDKFVTAVAGALTCEGMPLATRVQLGNETADFWSLPTTRLSADAINRMTTVCNESLATLEHQSQAAGCKP